MSKAKRGLVFIPSLRELPIGVQAASNVKYPAQLRVAGAFLFQRVIHSIITALKDQLRNGTVSDLTFVLVVPEELSYLRNALRRSNLRRLFPDLNEDNGGLDKVHHFTVWSPSPTEHETLSQLSFSQLSTELHKQFEEWIRPDDLVFMHPADVLIRSAEGSDSFFQQLFATPAEQTPNRPVLMTVSPSGDPENWTLFGIFPPDEGNDGTVHFELLRDRNNLQSNCPHMPGTYTPAGFTGLVYYPGALPEEGFPDFMNAEPQHRFRNDDSAPFNVWVDEHNQHSFFDFGRTLPYLQNKLTFSEARAHNSLKVDIERGFAIKTSKAPEFGFQCRWFAEAEVRGLPHRYLPETNTTVDTSEDIPVFTLETELFAYPTLGELATRNGMSAYDWNQAGLRVGGLLKSLSEIKYDIPADNFGRRCMSMYFHKTRSRLNEVLAAIDSGKFHSESFDVVSNIQFVLDNLAVYVNELCLPDPDLWEGGPILVHGDLCFSNILYDKTSRSLKVIDPRGIFGVPALTSVTKSPTEGGKRVLHMSHELCAPFSAGDIAYDVAKLMHSYRYGYEFILDNQYEAVPNSDGKSSLDRMQTYFTSPETMLRMVAFEQGLRNVLSEKTFQRAQAICALLFLSMVPLHSDRVDRQVVMLHLGFLLFGQNMDVLRHKYSQEEGK